MTISPVHVIGAGLAGCEAVTQLTRHGIPVILHEMRPVKSDEAHKTAYFAELVCSNSLRAANIENAVGLLKEEMRRLGPSSCKKLMSIRCLPAALWLLTATALPLP